MHRTLRFAPVVALLSLPGFAFAQADDFEDQETLEEFDIGYDGRSSGYFVQFSGMIVDTRDQDVNPGSGDFGAGGSGDIEFDTGWGLSAAIGYEFETAPFQVSVEYTYRNNDIDRLTGNAFGGPDTSSRVSGELDSHSIMFNALFDYDFTGTPFSWYAGGGIGVSIMNADLDSFDGSTVVDDNGGDDTQFAFQLMTGLEYQIDEHFTIFSGFRFYDANEPEFDFAKFDNDSLNYELGLRYYF